MPRLKNNWFVTDQGWAYVGAAWIKQGNNGSFLSVQLENSKDLPTDGSGNASIMLFKNNKKSAANQPDYNVLCQLPDGWQQFVQPPEQQQSPNFGGGAPQQQQQKQAGFGGGGGMTADDIPF